MKDKEPTTDTPISNLRNKLGSIFTVISLINDGASHSTIQDYAKLCDLEAVRKILSELEGSSILCD